MSELAERIEAEIRAKRLAPFEGQVEPGEFVVPHYEGYSIVNLINAVLARLGLEPPGPPLPRGLLPERPVRRVVLLLIDALGYRQLLRTLEREPDSFWARLVARGRLSPLTSVFPSTTVVALASLHTGLTPREHGVVGFRLFLRELGLIANLLRLKPTFDPEDDRLFRMGLTPRALLGAPTIHERLERAGVPSYVLIPRPYARSGLSRMLNPRAARLLPYASLADLMTQLRALLTTLEGRGERAFVFAYWDALDAVAHERGPETDAWRLELRTLAFALEQGLFPGGVAPLDGTLVLITSDHGQLPAPPKERVLQLKRHPGLTRRLRLAPTGEYRACYLHAKPDALRELEAGLKERFGDELVVVRSRDALEAGLFGPPHGRTHPETPERLGDLIAIPRGRQALYWPYDPFELKGRHGGLSDEEMLVPLIAL